MHWRKVTDNERGTDWRKFCKAVAALPAGTLWRHNAAGDLPSRDRVHIDKIKFSGLVLANTGRKGFTFTHYDALIPENASLLAWSNAHGFTVNLSANNLQHADQLSETGAGPVVVLMPEDCARREITPAGRPIVQCPETYLPDKTCKTCGLCAVVGRSVIVGFPAHGSGKKRAEAVVKFYSGQQHEQA